MVVLRPQLNKPIVLKIQQARCCHEITKKSSYRNSNNFFFKIIFSMLNYPTMLGSGTPDAGCTILFHCFSRVICIFASARVGIIQLFEHFSFMVT